MVAIGARDRINGGEQGRRQGQRLVLDEIESLTIFESLESTRLRARHLSLILNLPLPLYLSLPLPPFPSLSLYLTLATGSDRVSDVRAVLSASICTICGFLALGGWEFLIPNS